MDADADADAADLDLVVGPVAYEAKRVQVFLSAAHPSGRTAIVDVSGGELFSLLLEEFHWPEFEYVERNQRQVVRELFELAATHLFGHTTLTRSRGRWSRRKESPTLEVPWQGKTYLLTADGRRRKEHG